jgi:hypothetical protein
MKLDKKDELGVKLFRVDKGRQILAHERDEVHAGFSVYRVLPFVACVTGCKLASNDVEDKISRCRTWTTATMNPYLSKRLGERRDILH